MYRDAGLATHVQIDSLSRELADAERERQELRAERDRARIELQRVRDGVDPSPELETDTSYRRARTVLGVLSVIAAISMAAAIIPLCSSLVAEPLLDAQGLRNFGWHLAHGRGLVGLAAAGFVLVLSSPWLLLPWLGRRGLCDMRRWGWTLSVAGCALFLPTPLLPLAAFAMSVLLSRPVRSAFFHA
jgi:hypothetical protein